MKEGLYKLDLIIFHWINVDASNAFFDWFLPSMRIGLLWLPLYFFLLLFLWINFKRTAWPAILACIIAASISDLVSSRVMKPFFGRIRPCNDIALADWIHVRVPCGSGLSFTSSHASNHMALAVLLILLLGRRFPKIRIPLLIWSLLIGISQIYVGVHYPFDILGGFVLGSSIAYIMYLLYRQLPDSLQFSWFQQTHIH